MNIRTPAAAASQASRSTMADDIFFVLDNAGRFAFASPALARLLGHTPAELHGRDCLDFLDGCADEPLRIAQAWRRNREAPLEAECRWIHGEGEHVLRLTAWYDDDADLIYCAGQEVADGRGAQERAALRRLADLVAQGAAPERVFTAVTAELRALLGVAACLLGRYEPDGSVTVLSDSVDIGTGLAPGTILRYAPGSAGASVRETGATTPGGDVATLPGPLRERALRLGVAEAIKVPVMVDGQVWGYLSASWRGDAPPEAGSRMERFTELIMMAIDNADGRVRLSAARERLAASAEEEAALRRVATLVAEGAATADVLGAVATELRELLSIEFADLLRFEDDGTATVVAISDPSGVVSSPSGPVVGTRISTETDNLAGQVRRAGRAVLLGSYDDESSVVATQLQSDGLMGAVGVPVTVAGQQWGLAAIGWRQPVAHDVAPRLAEFTELLSIAIGNADSRERLAASRLRVITATDSARQRIERDLHDGVQQRLLALALDLRELSEHEVTADDLERLGKVLREATDELREIAGGIHPLVLRQHGLGRALRKLARRSSVPVRLDLALPGRLPESVEIAAYYVVSELLVNVAKHSAADRAVVHVETGGGELYLSVCDAGAGGADSARGTGLTGLRDRVEALGGTMTVDSPAGHGTTVRAWIPLPSPG